MNLWKEAKWQWGKLSLIEIAEDELQHAELRKLQAHTAFEAAEAQISAETKRIQRLKDQIAAWKGVKK